MTLAILGSLVIWLALLTLAFAALHSWSALYTGALAAVLAIEARART